MPIDFASDAANLFNTNEFAGSANLERQGNSDLPDIHVVLTRDVEVVGQDGASIVNRDIVQLLNAEVDTYSIDDRLTVGTEVFLLKERISDSGYITSVYCRNMNSP